jgi:hypothetical protein
VLVGKIDADLLAKYSFLAGAYCLLKYIENCRGNDFAANSMRFHFYFSELLFNETAVLCSISRVLFESNQQERMFIDRRTILNLELILNAKT